MELMNRVSRIKIFKKIAQWGSEELIEASEIEAAIYSARNELARKWFKDETLNKLRKATTQKAIGQQTLESLRTEINNLIWKIPCIIQNPKTFGEEYGDEYAATNVDAYMVPSGDKVYVKQFEKSYAQKYNIDKTYLSLLLQHEISHAIYKMLIDKKIYKDSEIYNIVIPATPQNLKRQFSKREYIYEPTEMVSRMNTIRQFYKIPATSSSGNMLADAFFKDVKNLTYSKQGKYWKVVVPEEEIEYPNIPDSSINAFFFKNAKSPGWNTNELSKLLIPYLMSWKMEVINDNFFRSMEFDLDRLARSMNMIAVNETGTKTRMA